MTKTLGKLKRSVLPPTITPVLEQNIHLAYIILLAWKVTGLFIPPM